MLTPGQKTRALFLLHVQHFATGSWQVRGGQNPLHFFSGKVKAIVSCCCSTYALVTGLESVSLSLFVVLMVCGLCSDGFQEGYGAAGQGWRCCTRSCVLTPTAELETQCCHQSWSMSLQVVPMAFMRRSWHRCADQHSEVLFSFKDGLYPGNLVSKMFCIIQNAVLGC